ncbi:hypothetical protein A33M_0818 [Rhodovulum sp. PH10]|nr:hypothetical protein A33M_0818 [Rhodovulum sp. PH10]
MVPSDTGREARSRSCRCQVDHTARGGRNRTTRTAAHCSLALGGQFGAHHSGRFRQGSPFPHGAMALLHVPRSARASVSRLPHAPGNRAAPGEVKPT